MLLTNGIKVALCLYGQVSWLIVAILSFCCIFDKQLLQCTKKYIIL